MSYQSEVLADSPNVFLRLAETSGTNANDETASNADGTYTGGYTLNQGGPTISGLGAVELNGTTGYVAVGNPSAVQITGQFTLEAWIYLNAFPAAHDQTYDDAYFNIAGKGYNGANEGYILRFQNVDGNKKIHAGSYDGSDHAVQYDASSLSLSTWYYVVARYDGTAWKLFINGTEVASSNNATGAISSSGDFTIGSSIFGGVKRTFNGRIANVAVYPTAISSTRIADHYTAATGGGGGSLASGTASVSSTGSTTATVTATAATGGTSPYTYQWYRSTSSGFTPGGGNIVSGATSLTLNDTGLSAATTYYYKLVSTDSAAATVTSNEINLTTSGGSLASGTASVSSTGITTATVTCGAASGGTSPYSYQWYRSTSSGFTPGGGNIVSGATSLTLNDTGLSSSTTYYYKLVTTDNVSATVTSNEINLTTSAPGSGPTITSSAVSTDGTQVVVNYSEVVTGVTAAGYTLSVDGVPFGIASVSGSGTSRTFELGNRWIDKAQTVTISYDQATGATLNGSSVELQTTTNASVTNSSTVNAGAIQHVGGRVSLFVHWSINTFYNQEWTDGSRDKNGFNPTALNFSQWMRAAKLIGAESVIWTVKHHDGFCCWHTNTTTYGVKDTTWGIANPTRDPLREYVDAARAAGLRVSIYFSIWDRNHGSQSMAWCGPQITELLTNYGEIDTIWTDGWGWNGGYNGTSNPTFEEFNALVKSLQPNCQVVENNHESSLAHTDLISKENYYDGLPSSTNRLPTQFTQTICGEPSSTPDQFVPGEWWYWHEPGTAGWTGIPGAASGFVSNINACLARRSNYSLNVSPDTTGQIPAPQLQRMAEIGVLLPYGRPSNYEIQEPGDVIITGGTSGNIIYGLI